MRVAGCLRELCFIVQAINRAADGDVFELAAGGGYACGVVVNKSITIYTVPTGGRAVFDCGGTQRALWVQDADVNITGLTVRNGAAELDGGGGVLVQQATLGKTVRFVACDWLNNTAPNGEGGGVLVLFTGNVSHGSVVFSACRWENNSAAADRGGGVSVAFRGVTTETTVAFVAGRWVGNGAKLGGAAVVQFADSASATSVSVSSCSFVDNSASRDGGALVVIFGTEAVHASVAVAGSLWMGNGARGGVGGGAVVVFATTATATNVSFADCLWTGNSALNAGAGAFVQFGAHATASSLSFTNCNFTHNRAFLSGGGGVLARTASSEAMRMYFSACVLESNDAAGDGGGVLLYGADAAALDLHFDACVWVANSGGRGGGLAALHTASVSGASVRFNACVWEGNRGMSGGGALVSLAAVTGSSLSFVASRWTDNAAAAFGVGGGLGLVVGAAQDVLVAFDACFFANNTALEGGGLLVGFLSAAAVTGARVTWQSCGWHNNNALDSGGGVMVYFQPTVTDPLLSFAACSWSSNRARTFGGLYVNFVSPVSGGRVQLSNCLWAGNAAQFGGGGGAVEAASATRLDVSFQSCSWANNTAFQSGGIGVNLHRAVAARVAFHDCVWERNKVGVGGGGAFVFLQESDDVVVAFTDCSFRNNGASIGGGSGVVSGALANATRISFLRCGWYQNDAIREGGGVGITFQDVINATTVLFDACTWEGNSAQMGGGVYVSFQGSGHQGNVTFTACSWTQNAADNQGGGLWLWLPMRPAERVEGDLSELSFVWTPSMALTVQDCQFVSNTVVTPASQGGAIWFHGADRLRLQRSHLQRNAAQFLGGGVSASGNVTLEVAACTFDNNTAPQGGHLYVDTQADVAVTDSQVALQTDAGWWVHQAQTFSVERASWTCPVGFVLRQTRLEWGDALQDDGHFFHRSTQQVECQACPAGLYSLDSALLSSESENATHQVVCEDCPYGGECSRGAADVRGLPGFFGVSEPAANNTNSNAPPGVLFTACPPGYCSAALHPWDESCAPHRQGRLCGECAPGFSQVVGSSQCAPDAQCSALAWMLPLSVALAALWLAVALREQTAGREGTLQVAVYFVNVAALLLPRPVLAPLVGLFHLCVEGGDSGALCAAPGLSTLASLFWGYLSPGLLVAVATVLRCTLGRGLSAQRWHRAAIELGLYSYSTCSRTTFVLLQCVPVEGVAGRFLYRSAGTACYQSWQVLLFVLLGALSLVPWLIGWLALSGRGGATVTVFLTSPFREGCRWWGGMLLLQIWLFNVLAAFVPDASHRALSLGGVALACALLHLLVRPFASAAVSGLQTLCTACWVVLALLALPAAVQASLATPSTGARLPDVDPWLSVFVLLPLVAVALVWLGATLMRWERLRWLNVLLGLGSEHREQKDGDVYMELTAGEPETSSHPSRRGVAP